MPKCHRTERKNRAGKAPRDNQCYTCMECIKKYAPNSILLLNILDSLSPRIQPGRGRVRGLIFSTQNGGMGTGRVCIDPYATIPVMPGRATGSAGQRSRPCCGSLPCYEGEFPPFSRLSMGIRVGKDRIRPG